MKNKLFKCLCIFKYMNTKKNIDQKPKTEIDYLNFLLKKIEEERNKLLSTVKELRDQETMIRNILKKLKI